MEWGVEMRKLIKGKYRFISSQFWYGFENEGDKVWRFLLLLQRHSEVGKNTEHNTQQLVAGSVRVQFHPYRGGGRLKGALLYLVDDGTVLYSRK